MKHGGGGKKKPAITDEKPADPHGRRDNLAGLTLFAVLGAGDEVAKENKKTWKHFKEKLGLKGAAWTSTAPIPASDVPIHPMSSRTMSRRVSNRFPSGEYPADEYKPELAQSASRRELRPTPSNRMSLSRNQSRSLRHKGEPFVPCGHTFCRLCSRELWAEKGNCPLCNNFILEILDIF
nr:LON peptidase N-terminal domain and RING finger protein 3-like [Ipomoea batatas]